MEIEVSMRVVYPHIIYTIRFGPNIYK